ncbi:MAG: trypsin-like peptidase domain-containing protein [Elainellaceae cyanobacterium]
MTRLSSFKSQPKFARLAIYGLLTLQTAIASTLVGEIILTTPNGIMSRAAVAQSSQADAVDEAVVFVQTDRGSGSGVIVESDGLIITNAHVVEDARQVTVNIGGEQVDADVVAMGSSQCLDLALLRVEGQTNLPTIELAEADAMQKRQPVYAMGYPGGVPARSASVVQGIISNIHHHEGFLQLDAAINPGNSGGAIIDRDNMKLLGVATARMRDREGITFAISIDKVRAFIDAYHQGITAPLGQFVIPGSEDNAVPQPISLDSGSISGNLEANDSRLCGDFSETDLYTFEAEAGQSVMFNITSQQMEMFLALIDPSGNVLQFDNSDRGRSAFVLEKLTQSGTYTVMINTTQPGEVGSYQLRMTAPMLVEEGAIDLSTAPCTTEGNLCRTYSFQGQANQTISILHGAEFMPYLVLFGPNGDVVASGQVEQQGASTIELPADGWYDLVVGNVDPGDRGNFFISVHDTQDLVETEEVSQR